MASAASEPIVALRQPLTDGQGYVRARAWSNLFQWLKARLVGNAGTCVIRWGTGGPNGVISGTVGDLFIRRDGGAVTTFYVKESGVNTTAGWVGK